MSQDNSYSRSTAVKVTSAEVRLAQHQFKDGNQERSPRKLTLPSGVNAGRVAFAGVLTDIEDVASSGSAYLKATIVDNFKGQGDAPEDADADTYNYGGRIHAYAGQYAPEAKATLQSLDAPQPVFVVGSPQTYEPDDDTVIVSVSPETIQPISMDRMLAHQTRTAEQTLDRLDTMGDRLDDGDDGAEMAVEHNTTEDREIVLDGVTNGLEEIDGEVAPTSGGDTADQAATDGGAASNAPSADAVSETISEADLEEYTYHELRGLAASLDDNEVDGNSSKDEIVNALVDRPKDLIDAAA